MLDVLYVGATVGFFALMLAYVRGCERIGQGAAEPSRPENPSERAPDVRPDGVR